MSNPFELKPGEYVKDVIVHVKALENKYLFQLPVLEHITRVYLNEWQLGDPGSCTDQNGTFVLFNPTLVRLDFSQGQFTCHVNTNLPGTGYPVALANSGPTHIVYDRPRMMGEFHRGYLSGLPISLTGVNAVNSGPLNQHQGLTLCLSLVCKNPRWNPDERVALGLVEPRFIEGQGGGRAGWQ